MRKRHPLAVAVALLNAVALASAQNRQTEVASSPVAGWTFLPGVTIGMMYDSNVAITSAPADTRTTPNDTLYTIDPVGTLRFVGKRTTFDSSYRGTIRRYQELSGLNGFDQHVKASLERRATKRLTLFAQNTYSSVPTTDELDLSGVPFRRAGSQHNALAGGMSYRLNEHDTLSARYDFTWVKFDRNAPDLTGGTINGVHADVLHAFTNRFSAGAEGSLRFAQMDFLTGRDLRFVDFGGTVDYRLDEVTKLSGAAGYAHLDDELFQTTRAGMYVRGSLSRIALRSVLGVSYERSFVPSFGFGGSNRSQEVRGWVDFPPIGHRVFVQSSIAWRRNEPFEAEDLQADTIQFRSTTGYAVSRWMRAQGFYIFTRQDSIVRGGEINRHRIGGELVLSQPMRIR